MMTFTLKGVSLDNMCKLGLVLPLLLGRPPYLPHQDPRAISLFSLNPSWHKVNTKLNDPEKMLLRGILKVELLVLDGGVRPCKTKFKVQKTHDCSEINFVIGSCLKENSNLSQ